MALPPDVATHLAPPPFPGKSRRGDGGRSSPACQPPPRVRQHAFKEREHGEGDCGRDRRVGSIRSARPHGFARGDHRDPFGAPSDALRFGRLGGTEVVFLARHGRGHRFSPSGINYRANIFAMKLAGVTDLISVSACGSFKPELYPGLFVLVDQFVDRTFARESSFFGNGCVAHVSMAHPVAPLLQERIESAAQDENIDCQARRNLRVHGRPAVFVLRGIDHLQGSQLRRDRHDRDAGGQARARGRDSPTRQSPWSPTTIAGIPSTRRWKSPPC